MFLTHGAFQKAHRLLSGAKWLGYNLNGKLCWVTEGNVQGEDKAACCKYLMVSEPDNTDLQLVQELQPCRLRESQPTSVVPALDDNDADEKA